jgi:hypothetical protein
LIATSRTASQAEPHMPDEDLLWDFDSAINLLNSLSLPKYTLDEETSSKALVLAEPQTAGGLGNFSSLWDFLGRPHDAEEINTVALTRDGSKYGSDPDQPSDNRAIRWRDEVDGEDLEDSIEPPKAALSAAALRTAKRAERRARARARAEQLAASRAGDTDTATDYESAGEELEALRRSPDRTAIIDSILGRSRPKPSESPPTSPSPPKGKATPRRDWPVSEPYLFKTSGVPVIAAREGWNPRERKQNLINLLRKQHRAQERFLKSSGLLLPEFTTLNKSSIGVHVFIDMSNIAIGFHDCLKLARGMTRDTWVRRVPLDFHNLSLVLERGRPAAKRVLVGSDRTIAVSFAESLGYETNILERVHKSKELTPRQLKYASRSAGETSGSETNTGFTPRAAAKWVEQAVDEILHLKILESLIDSETPSTIVLATGDAAEAEYSGGFLKMVERALAKGWQVELVSFKLNTSSMYLRPEFRAKWGQLFKWIQLDDYAEFLIDTRGD